ncbi:alpha/beta hydrolase [Nocardia sp. 2]|uniref:Alpha/beta hydrolase n=1 Tax=Nocardia acididurans TaxID=2802282 RepID=A0ABS1M722_9NOCA|nr:alpha/beta hydrolase [Nocardia acididurans]MBL1076442.1 alpha/beta hydrolase [Nocardia acididurans]
MSVAAIAHSTPRTVTVCTEDRVGLAVEVSGPRDAALTVVLLHGHCGRSGSWVQVRDALRRECPQVRIVCYDHRGHGDSEVAARHTYNLERLGHDLRDVLEAVAPDGPVVLVGHSMGGMSALTYVGQNSHEVGDRIVGMGLIATAASGIGDAGLGRFLRHPVISLFQAAVRWAPGLMHHAKQLAGKAFAPIVRAAELGERTVSPQVLTLANAIHNQTPIVPMAAFLDAFTSYDRTAALNVLSKIPTLVLCGSADLMTPPSHSIAMAAAVDYSDLVLIDGAGHSVIMEQPAQVSDALLRLIARASDIASPRTRLAAA